MDDDLQWVARALALARMAEVRGEVPVGAVVVFDDEALGEGWNCPIATHDPTAHAEIVALRAASRRLGNYRLLGTTLYVSLEPCLMCVGAMIHARIKRLVFGAYDPNGGAARTLSSVFPSRGANQRIDVTGGVRADESVAILRSFFQVRR
jgi:tRNA(adenine34) deaminase